MTYIPDVMRRAVIDRARESCEYCLIHQRVSLYTHEVDHVIPLKHRGETTPDNLCLACLDCNRAKDSDIGSFDPETGDFALLFNPRQQPWSDHFRLDKARIVPLTPEGRVTILLLKLNDPLRVRARRALLDVRRYPMAGAD